MVARCLDSWSDLYTVTEVRCEAAAAKQQSYHTGAASDFDGGMNTGAVPLY